MRRRLLDFNLALENCLSVRKEDVKASFRIFIFSFILCPILVLSYQNCSDLSSRNQATDQGQLHSLDHPTYPAVFLNDLKILNYSTSSCSPETIEDLPLFHKDLNFCTLAKNTCEAAFLIHKGFSEDLFNAHCPEGTPDLEAYQPPSPFEVLQPEDFNYEQSPELVCAMYMEELVSYKYHACISARNGCEVSYLKSLGFVPDQNRVCSF